MKNIGYISALIICFLHTAKAQIKNAINLPDVQIVSNPYVQQLFSNKNQDIDSFIRLTGNNLSAAELLSLNSQVFVKNYGPMQLSTTSLRGCNASQTPLVWLGVPLQNPMLGQSDLSLIPSFLFNQIQVNYTNNPAVFGSGNIGGSINLKAPIPEGKKIGVELMLKNASFNNYAWGVGLNQNSSRIKSTHKLYRNFGLNNFTFNNNGATQRASNAAFDQLAWMSSAIVNLSKKHSLNAHAWVQNANRELTPALNTTPTFASQQDLSQRYVLAYQYKKTNTNLLLRTVLFSDYIGYHQQSLPKENNYANTLAFYSDYYLNFKNNVFHLGFTSQRANASGSTYSNVNQNRTAVFAGFQRFGLNQKYSVQAMVRQEVADGTLIPVMPSVSIKLTPTKWLNLFANTSRSFRLPTFNDLHWRDLFAEGNANLKPETGWGSEIGLGFDPAKAFNIQATAYSKRIYQWIIWLPNETGKFTPINLDEVYTRGIEVQWHLQWKGTHKYLYLDGMSDYNLAENTSGQNAGRQLIYTPKIKHNLKLTGGLGNVYAFIVSNYVGIRYTATDLSSWLSPYTLLSAGSGFWFKLKENTFKLNALVQNITNQNVMIVANRPIPLINYQITIQYIY